MAMAGTNLGCRAIPHDELAFVHPAFFVITVALVLGLGPRVAFMALRGRASRRARHGDRVRRDRCDRRRRGARHHDAARRSGASSRPQGAVAATGTLPVGIALSRDGSRVFELEAGYRKPALRVLDATTLHEIRSIPLGGAFGPPLRDADGDGVWVDVAGTFQEQIAHLDTERGVVGPRRLAAAAVLPVGDRARGATARWPSPAISRDKVAFVDPAGERLIGTVQVGSHPAALAFAADGTTLFVADRGASQVDVIDERARTVRTHIAVGLHPDALATDGGRVYVADSDDDDVAVIDAAARARDRARSHSVPRGPTWSARRRTRSPSTATAST